MHDLYGLSALLTTPGISTAIMENNQMAGFSEASIGAVLTLKTGGIGGLLGGGFLMAHGSDQFFTGVNTLVYGIPTKTVSEELLVKAGMSSDNASLLNDGMSLFGSMGGIKGIQMSQVTKQAISFSKISKNTNANNIKLFDSNQPSSYKFSDAAGKHMHEKGRRIPVHILDDIITQPISLAKDPRGPSNAMMHYSRLWRNGKLYNVEVLYDKGNNKIFHYMYTRDPLGPLPKIPGAGK